MEADYYYGEDYKSQRSDYTEETAIYSNSVNAGASEGEVLNGMIPGRLAGKDVDGKEKGAGLA